jgi:hypothetical protein
MTWAELLAQSAWRGSIVLAAALAAEAGMRGASAAVRHFVWTAALAAMVMLPAALVVAPKWSWRVERAERVESVVVVSQEMGAISKNTGGKGVPSGPGATNTNTKARHINCPPVSRYLSHGKNGEAPEGGRHHERRQRWMREVCRFEPAPLPPEGPERYILRRGLDPLQMGL